MLRANGKEMQTQTDERDDWIAFCGWAFGEEAWHVATRFADLLGERGARAVCHALARAERAATGRERLALNEARLMLLGAIERRWG